jgi:pimeloyl-ACP methyl ester carboxylesterase
MLAYILKILALVWLVTAGVWVGATADHLSPVLVLLGAVCVLFGHSIVLAIEFALLHRLHRAHTRYPTHVILLVRAWFSETLIALQVFLWEQAFRSKSIPDHMMNSAGRRSVVLVHGYLCNRGFWNSWMCRLHALGIPYCAVTLEPIFGSIDDAVAAIDRVVSEVTQATGLAPVVVAHSMGGLSVRAWMRAQATDDRVHRVVTIGSPHQGAWLARYASSRNAKQMRIGSPWLEALKWSEPASRYRRFTCFYGRCDNMVFPMECATLPGADNRHVDEAAHIQMAHRDEVFGEVIRLLDVPGVAG